MFWKAVCRASASSGLLPRGNDPNKTLVNSIHVLTPVCLWRERKNAAETLNSALKTSCSSISFPGACVHAPLCECRPVTRCFFLFLRCCLQTLIISVNHSQASARYTLSWQQAPLALYHGKQQQGEKCVQQRCQKLQDVWLGLLQAHNTAEHPVMFPNSPWEDQGGRCWSNDIKQTGQPDKAPRRLIYKWSCNDRIPVFCY